MYIVRMSRQTHPSLVISNRILLPVAAVDFTDFLKLMATKMPEQESEEDLNEAFRVFDKEGQGLKIVDTYIVYIHTCIYYFLFHILHLIMYSSGDNTMISPEYVEKKKTKTQYLLFLISL